MQVRACDSGQEALEILRTDPRIDAVLIDIMMPGLDGYDTIRAIRKMESHARIPIVALTAKAMRGDRQRCLDAGASDYISKPVPVDRLLSVLSQWLPGGARRE
jgi:CheY-like chemotaxis protein